MVQAIAPNAFFVFAGTFPTNNAVANLLLGAPVTFYQGLGDFTREVRVWSVGAYAQDEWRVGPRRDAELRPALRAHQPVHRGRGSPERLRARACSRRSGPTRRSGSVFPGDPGIGRGIAHSANAFMPRVGVAWDPTGDGTWSVRASYGLFYDQFQNGVGHRVAGGDQRDAVGAVQPVQRRRPELPEPVSGARRCPRPTRSSGRRRCSRSTRTRSRRACRTGTLSVQRVAVRSLPRRSPLRRRRGQRACRATSKRTRRSTGRAPRRRTPTAAASTPTARPTAAPAISRRSRCCGTSRARRTTRARRASSRRFGAGVGFNVSYWYSKSFDDLSAMNLSGAAAKPLAGENDLAQNPFDLEAEYGPVAVRRAPPLRRQRELGAAGRRPARRRRCARSSADWQLNAIATHNSGTPFTVSDSANVALQANSPPISGFPASRPNLVGDPNGGPRTVDEWISRSAFQRLNVQTQAGQFGNAGRNIARGPAYTNVDVSLVRDFRARRARRACSSAPKSSTWPTTPTSACRSPT